MEITPEIQSLINETLRWTGLYYSLALILPFIMGFIVLSGKKSVSQKLAMIRTSSTVVFMVGLALRFISDWEIHPAWMISLLDIESSLANALSITASILSFALLYLFASLIPLFFFQKKLRKTSISAGRAIFGGLASFLRGVLLWVGLYFGFFFIQREVEQLILQIILGLLYTTTLLILSNSLGLLLLRFSKSRDRAKEKELFPQFKQEAQILGIELKQLFYIITDHIKMANAAASSFFQPTVYLYSYLHNNINPQELKAIMTHEYGHLHHKHTFKRIAIVTLGITSAMLVITAIRDAVPQLDGLADFFITIASIYLFVTILPNIISRRQEFEADHFAITNGNSAEDLVRGLIKTIRLNDGKFTEAPTAKILSTHPSLKQRIARMETHLGHKILQPEEYPSEKAPYLSDPRLKD